MTGTEIALLIGAIAGGIGGLLTAIAALLKTREDAALNQHERDELRKESAEQKKQIEELKANRITDRRDIILLGEMHAETREDLTVVTDAFNRVYREFHEATGHKPTTDLIMLRNLHRIRYNTGRLEPLDASEQ